MRVAPIIHTRTYACDFNSEFAVRPECFMDSDVKWARGNVLGATGEIDELRGVRWLVSDNGKYRMAGAVGFLKDICSKCQLNDADRTKSQELFYDNNGRLVYAFIGVVMDKQHNDFRELTFDYLWGIYLDKIYPIWKRTYQEVILEDFVEIDTKQITRSDVEEPSVVGESFFYETNSARDYKLFLNFLCDERETGFSFCSNILSYNMVKNSNFTYITTSQNIIKRMTKGCDATRKTQEEQVKATSVYSNVASTQKKNGMIVLIVGLVLLLIIICILILV